MRSRISFVLIVCVGIINVVQSQLTTFIDCPRNCTCALPTNDDQTILDNSDIIVNCRARGYTSIPTDQIKCDHKQIDFSDNDIEVLTRNSFRGLQQLERITITNNKIKYIEAGAFAGLPNLRSINLGENNLDEVDERIFWGSDFESVFFEVDDNPFYCDYDLKRTVRTLEKTKATFIGLRCKNGDLRRPVRKRARGRTLKGEDWEIARERIRRRLFSWHIGWIAAGCWTIFWTVVVLCYFLLRFDDGRYMKALVRNYRISKEKTFGKRYRDDEFDEVELEEGGEQFYPPPDGEFYDEDYARKGTYDDRGPGPTYHNRDPDPDPRFEDRDPRYYRNERYPEEEPQFEPRPKSRHGEHSPPPEVMYREGTPTQRQLHEGEEQYVNGSFPGDRVEPMRYRDEPPPPRRPLSPRESSRAESYYPNGPPGGPGRIQMGIGRAPIQGHVEVGDPPEEEFDI